MTTSSTLPTASPRTSRKPSASAAGPVSARAELKALYRTLLLARRAEELIRREYASDQMKTPVHLGIGQEAIPVGVCHALPAGSQTFGTYRNHALYLAVTGDSDGFFGELYGRATGPGKGKAGSMHLASPARGLMATSAVVGTTIPVAVGAALAHAYQGRTDDVVAVFFGDGAVEEGVFWESLNFACLRRLRVLFVCEDNGLAIHTPTEQRQGFRSIPEAVQGFRCHVASCHGEDVLDVSAATRGLLQRMREEPQPAVLHARYFRLLEHVGPREDFEAGYRTRPSSDELKAWDPVHRLEQVLAEQGWTPAELTEIRADVDARLEASLRNAQAAPFPAPEELHQDVLVEPPASPAAGRPVAPARAVSTMTFRQAVALALSREMDADPSVLVFGLDVPDHKRIYGSTAGLVERFGPRRCFGTPLSEEAMTGAALGAALSGLRPVHVHIRADFALLAMNQIVNMVSTMRYMSGGRVTVPLVIRAVIGRGWGQSAQHSKSLHGVFAHFPGLKVVMPASPQDGYSLLRAAIRDDNPVIVLEHRWLYDVEGEVDEAAVAPLGQSLVRRAGSDLTVAATSWMVVEALKAADVLSRRGIELEVVDVRTVAPLGAEPILASVRKTGRAIVADYDWVFCGFSAELAARISEGCFEALKRPVARLGFAHVPCPTTRPLENAFYPSAATIIRTTERLLGVPEMDLSGEAFYTYEQRFKGPF